MNHGPDFRSAYVRDFNLRAICTLGVAAWLPLIVAVVAYLIWGK